MRCGYGVPGDGDDASGLGLTEGGRTVKREKGLHPDAAQRLIGTHPPGGGIADDRITAAHKINPFLSQALLQGPPPVSRQ